MEFLDREQLIERLSKIDFIVVGLETEVTHGLTITRISIMEKGE
jgi:hypothetical protein